MSHGMKHDPLQRCLAWCRSDAGALVFLGILTFLTFLRVLRAEFLSYDDPFYVTNNTTVQGGLSWKSLIQAWTTFECANWHPGTWMSLMLDYQIYGLQAWGFHLTNLLLHVANTLLVFVLLRRLKVEYGPALFVAAVFGVHPLHVESVAWITERKDVLATLFGLLAILAYVRSIQNGSWRQRVLSYCWFACSLISKPLLVTLPCLLLVLDYGPLQRGGQRDEMSPVAPSRNPTSVSTISRFLALALEKWPYWLLALGSSIITVIAQHEGGAVASLHRFGLSERLANVGVSYCRYLQKSFWPTGLAVYYPYSMNRWGLAGLLGALGLVLIITGVAWQVRRRYPNILTGWLWFVGTLVPMIGIVQVGSQAMADRYMYLPLIGLAWAATSATLACWPATGQNRWLQRIFGCGLILVMCLLTWQQTGVWQNNLKLSEHALAVTSGNYVAHGLHARSLRTAGQIEPAIAEYRQAIAINPEYYSARNDLGLLLLQRDDLAGAVEQFQAGLKVVPQHFRLRWNLANALVKQRDFSGAHAAFQAAELAAPVNDALVLDHARALLQAKRYPEALPLYEKALALDPNSLVNQLELAVALSRVPADQGRDLARSIRILQKLCNQTDAPRAWITLAETQVAAGQKIAAEKAWQHAIQRAKSLNRPDLAELARASRSSAGFRD